MSEKEAQDIILGKIRTVDIDELTQHMIMAPTCCAECVFNHFNTYVMKMKVYRV